MKKFRIYFPVLAIIISFAGTSCKTSFEEIKYSDGNADFSRFVAIGSNYFAGFSDRALYKESQAASIPAILSTRFSFVGGGIFLQPDVRPGLGIGFNDNSKYVLKRVPIPCLSEFNLVPQPFAPNGDATNFNWLGNTFPFNNLAVPGTRITDLRNQSYGDPSPFLGNPFYARFASNPSTSTIAGDALLTNPTFIAVWMGMDDIYNYALSGGVEGGDSITSPAYFAQLYGNLIDEQTSQNEGGVLLNIPALNTIPFFTAVKWNGLTLDAITAAQLTALYSGINSAITFSAGANPYVIADVNEPTGFRQVRQGEYILLSVSRDSVNCFGWGTTVPIPERYVLDADEVTTINTAIGAYNTAIFTEAVEQGIAFADMNRFFKNFNTGIGFNGINFTVEYLHGGAFSTDGFNLSQRGAALVANEVITNINRHYSAKIPQVDANSFSGIIFP